MHTDQALVHFGGRRKQPVGCSSDSAGATSVVSSMVYTAYKQMWNACREVLLQSSQRRSSLFEAAIIDIASFVPSTMSDSKLPWDTFPPAPGLPLQKAHRQGLVDVGRGIKLWHAIFGVELEESRKAGRAPVFFLHGGMNSSEYYGHQVEYFSTHHTVIVLDLRGHGRSPLGEDTHLTYDKIGDDLIGLLDHYAILKAAMVGWSEGTMVVWNLLARYPHRVERAFCYAAIDDCTKTDSEAVMKIPMVQEYFARVGQEWNQLNPEGDWQKFFGTWMDLWVREPKWSQATFKNTPGRGQSRLAPIVWVVKGDHDDWIPADHYTRFTSYVPNSSFLVMPSTGHLAFIQSPAMFNRFVELFLEDGAGNTNPKPTL